MPETLSPKILFAGHWLPAHEVWDKLEAAATAADVLERLNKTFPDLATDFTRQTVVDTKRRLKEVEVQMPHRVDQAPQMRARALELLRTAAPEQVLEILAEEFDTTPDLPGLLYLTGPEPYLRSLQRELDELRQNKVSPEQAASLWNELQRLAPGGGLWTARKVQELLDSASG